MSPSSPRPHRRSLDAMEYWLVCASWSGGRACNGRSCTGSQLQLGCQQLCIALDSSLRVYPRPHSYHKLSRLCSDSPALCHVVRGVPGAGQSWLWFRESTLEVDQIRLRIGNRLQRSMWTPRSGASHPTRTTPARANHFFCMYLVSHLGASLACLIASLSAQPAIPRYCCASFAYILQ